MTRFNPGDDVIIEFDGLEHRGEVIHTSKGSVLAKIIIDADADYGSITSRLAPQSTVCVHEKHVKHTQQTT